MISVLLDVLGGGLLLVGLLLFTIGLIGMLRTKNVHDQLHAQGLATGPGVIAVLAASVATENAAIIALAAVGIAFTVLSSPVSGHAIARADYRRRRAAEDSRAAEESRTDPPGETCQ